MLHTHLSSGAGTVVQLTDDVPSGLSLTPAYETKKTGGCLRSKSFGGNLFHMRVRL
jgi:hypothetical protein